MSQQQKNAKKMGTGLRTKTLFLVSTTLIAMMILLVLFSQTIVKKGFETVEERDALLNVNRVRDAFAMQVENVSVKIIDWSMWDDAYLYMQDGNAAFEKSSLAIGALLGMKCDLFLWRLPDGTMRWGRQFDLDKGADLPVHPDVLAFFDKNGSLFQFKDEQDKKEGIIDIPQIGPTFIAIQPIVKSSGQGPIVGALIAGRAINKPMIEKLKTLTHLDLSLATPASLTENALMAEAATKLNDEHLTYLRNVSENLIAGTTFFKDLFNKPVAYVQMTAPREIHAQGKSTIMSFFVALAIAGFGFGAVVLFMLERSVISRVTGLANSLNDIRHNSNLSLRVPVSGKDEISVLSGATNDMLTSIEEGQKVITARNDDMKLILDNAEQGFLNVSLTGEITGERSAVVDRWFGAPNETQKIWDFLHAAGSKNSRMFRLGWDQLTDDFLPFEVTADQMPNRIKKGDNYFQVKLRPVMREEKISSILTVVSDVTEAIKAEAKESEQREMMRIFHGMLSDKNAVAEFFEDTRKGVRTLEQQPAMARDLQMRLIHTLKGNAAQHGLEIFAKICHELESKMTDDQSYLLATEDIEMVKQAWDSVEQRFAYLFAEAAQSGMDITAGELQTAVQMATKHEPHERIADLLKSWQMDPVKQRLARLGKVAEQLGKRLEKPDLHIVVQDHGIRVEKEVLRDVWSNMVHVIRNAVDHGIETADERLDRGKKEQGTITLASRIEGQHLVLEVADDGKGIDWDAIRDVAKRKDLPHQSQEDLIAALFEDGVSSKSEVTEISGRGVGMAAIKQQMTKLNGRIHIQSAIGKGTRFLFYIPRSSADFMVEFQSELLRKVG